MKTIKYVILFLNIAITSFAYDNANIFQIDFPDLHHFRTNPIQFNKIYFIPGTSVKEITVGKYLRPDWFYNIEFFKFDYNGELQEFYWETDGMLYTHTIEYKNGFINKIYFINIINGIAREKENINFLIKKNNDNELEYYYSGQEVFVNLNKEKIKYYDNIIETSRYYYNNMEIFDTSKYEENLLIEISTESSKTIFTYENTDLPIESLTNYYSNKGIVVKRIYTYDDNNWLVNYEDVQIAGEPVKYLHIHSYEYDFDNRGNWIRRKETISYIDSNGKNAFQMKKNCLE